jgi:hypothetical protein
MGLFDWLSGLFGSKSDEENNDSENKRESDDDKGVEAIQSTFEGNEAHDQAHSDLITQDEHETESNPAEADTQHDKGKA